MSYRAKRFFVSFMSVHPSASAAGLCSEYTLLEMELPR